MLNIEETRYALQKIMEVLESPYDDEIDYNALKIAADRHTTRLRLLESGQEELAREFDIPKQLILQDFKELRKICQSYVDDLEKDGYVDEDHSHYIFETAMTCIFGKDVWKWINSKK